MRSAYEALPHAMHPGLVRVQGHGQGHGHEHAHAHVSGARGARGVSGVSSRVGSREAGVRCRGVKRREPAQVRRA